MRQQAEIQQKENGWACTSFDAGTNTWHGKIFRTRGEAEAEQPQMQARIDQHEREMAENRARTEAEEAKYTAKTEIYNPARYIKKLSSNAAFSRFLGEFPDAGYIPQAYGPFVPVYSYNGRLVVVSDAGGYSYVRNIFSVPAEIVTLGAWPEEE